MHRNKTSSCLPTLLIAGSIALGIAFYRNINSQEKHQRSEVQYVQHTVKPGDTIWNCAVGEGWKGDWSKYQKLFQNHQENSGIDIHYLSLGRSIYVPDTNGDGKVDCQTYNRK